MKKLVITTALAAILATSLGARGHHHGHHFGHRGNAQNAVENTTQANTQTVTETLTQKQQEDLQFMYEEEKLARDVYITLGNIWNTRVFSNIQNSEQRHMNSVKYLLNKYNVEVPVLSDDIGVFVNEEIQALYNELVEKGKESLKDALEVGVIIEETDIADLEEKKVGATADIQRVFDNLLKGSYNHLRAFNRNLQRVE